MKTTIPTIPALRKPLPGLNLSEAAAFELVTAAANAVLRMERHDVLHPMDREEYCTAFHVIQEKILARPLVRAVRYEDD